MLWTYLEYHVHAAHGWLWTVKQEGCVRSLSKLGKRYNHSTWIDLPWLQPRTTMKKLKSSLMKLHAGRIRSGLAVSLKFEFINALDDDDDDDDDECLLPFYKLHAFFSYYQFYEEVIQLWFIKLSFSLCTPAKMERHGCQPPRHQCRICWSPWQAWKRRWVKSRATIQDTWCAHTCFAWMIYPFFNWTTYAVFL